MEAIPSESMDDSGTESPFFQLLKERKKTIIFVIFVVLIIFLAVFTTREPEAEVTWIRVKAVSISSISFEITLEVDNGNIIGGTLNTLEADIYYNDEYIGHARTTEKYDIKALGKSTLKVDLTIDNLPSSIDISPEIRAKGTANISVSFLSFDKEFDKTVYG
jgi:LEA14-like dessication related protein